MPSDKEIIEEAAVIIRELPVEHMAEAMRLYKLGVAAGRACPHCPHCIARGAFGMDPNDPSLTTNQPAKRARKIRT